jgi:hypothetical protein
MDGGEHPWKDDAVDAASVARTRGHTALLASTHGGSDNNGGGIFATSTLHGTLAAAAPSF